MQLPNPCHIFVTRGVHDWALETGVLRCLLLTVQEEFNKQPDRVTDGGNDKFFFSMAFCNKRLFVAANELNGLTVMFPHEY